MRKRWSSLRPQTTFDSAGFGERFSIKCWARRSLTAHADRACDVASWVSLVQSTYAYGEGTEHTCRAIWIVGTLKATLTTVHRARGESTAWWRLLWAKAQVKTSFLREDYLCRQDAYEIGYAYQTCAGAGKQGSKAIWTTCSCLHSRCTANSIAVHVQSVLFPEKFCGIVSSFWRSSIYLTFGAGTIYWLTNFDARGGHRGPAELSRFVPLYLH